MMDQPTMPVSWNVRVTADHKFILGCNGDEYVYDTVEELLNGLKSDLEEEAGESNADDSENEPAHEKKSKVKKMMEGADNEE